MNKTIKTKAIILSRTDYGEADRIMQCITPTGKIGVIAHGVRREKSKLAGGVELLAVCDLVIMQGKGELYTLMSSRLDQFFGNILQRYEVTQEAFRAIKLVSKGSESFDSPEWYDMALQVLSALDSGADSKLARIWIYLHYADLMGYELGLHYDISGNVIKQDLTYSYDVAEKGLRQDDRGELTTDHVKLLRLLATRPLSVVARVGGVSDLLDSCLLVSRAHAAV